MRKIGEVAFLLLIVAANVALGQDTPQQLGKMVCEAANAKDFDAYRELIHPKCLEAAVGEKLAEKEFKVAVRYSPFPIGQMKFKTRDLRKDSPLFRMVRFYAQPQKQVRLTYRYQKGPKKFGSKGTGIAVAKHEGKWWIVLGELKSRPKKAK